MPAAVARIPTAALWVARLRSPSPSPLHVFADRLEFDFAHPHDARLIHMVMRFGDMTCAHLAITSTDARAERAPSLAFAVRGAMEQFGSDYTARGPWGDLAILLVLPTRAALTQLQTVAAAEVPALASLLRRS